MYNRSDVAAFQQYYDAGVIKCQNIAAELSYSGTACERTECMG